MTSLQSSAGSHSYSCLFQPLSFCQGLGLSPLRYFSGSLFSLSLFSWSNCWVRSALIMVTLSRHRYKVFLLVSVNSWDVMFCRSSLSYFLFFKKLVSRVLGLLWHFQTLFVLLVFHLLLQSSVPLLPIHSTTQLSAFIYTLSPSFFSSATLFVPESLHFQLHLHSCTYLYI